MTTKRTILLLACSAAFVTIIVYAPALGNGFVNYDDNKYITENYRLGSLDFKFLAWAFTTFSVYNWHPLTWLSYGVDHSLWGNTPFGYHLTDVLLHALNVLLVVLLTARLIAAWFLSKGREPSPPHFLVGVSVLTGLLFGLHPIHVESVAWAAERKDVLSLFFFLCSLIAYTRYAEADKRNRNYAAYALSLFCFILALLSKSMAVTLPLVLLILDVVPYSRIAGAGMRRILLEKAPFFAMSILTGIFTLMAQQSGGAVRSLTEIGLNERLILTGRAMAFYLRKFVMPTGLAPFYPVTLPVRVGGEDIVAGGILILIAASCITLRKKWPVWSAAWLFYVVTLLPVLGIVKMGTQAAADRYTYIPLLGPMLLAGLGAGFAVRRVNALVRGRRSALIAVWCLAVFLLGGLAGSTVRQIGIWRNPISLWTREIEVDPFTNPIGYLFRAEAYFSTGLPEQAIADYDMAIQMNPADFEARFSRGMVYYSTRRFRAARDDFNAAAAINPAFTTARLYADMASRRLRDADSF